MEKVKISTEFIKLDQFMKWQGLTDTGVDAKLVIHDGQVKVNGTVELQRGKKLRKGDIVEFEGQTFEIG